MAKTVGKRRIKAKKPVSPPREVKAAQPVSRRREVNLFDMSDGFGDFADPFDEDDRSIKRLRTTTRNLTVVAIALPLVGMTTALISTL